jgi:hypothetical protein
MTEQGGGTTDARTCKFRCARAKPYPQILYDMPGSEKSPFVEVRPKLRAFDRFLRRRRPEDAAIEVNNLFARAVRVRSVTADEVHAVFERYGIRIPDAAPREKLYRDYLRYCLSDRRLTDEEVADLDHLRDVLHLDAGVVDLLHRRVAREVYSRTVDEVLADAAIDEAERQFLTTLRQHLAIPDAIADNIVDMKQRQRGDRLPRPKSPGQPGLQSTD